MEEAKMKKLEIDFEKLRAGEEVKCPKCKNGVLRTEYDPKISHYFKIFLLIPLLSLIARRHFSPTTLFTMVRFQFIRPKNYFNPPLHERLFYQHERHNIILFHLVFNAKLISSPFINTK